MRHKKENNSSNSNISRFEPMFQEQRTQVSALRDGCASGSRSRKTSFFPPPVIEVHGIRLRPSPPAATISSLVLSFPLERQALEARCKNLML